MIRAAGSRLRAEATSQRCSSNFLELGQRVGAPALGFRVNAAGRLEKEAIEQKTIRRIRRLRTKGWTLQAIANRLNADGVPTKRGGRWHPSTVAYIVGRLVTTVTADRHHEE